MSFVARSLPPNDRNDDRDGARVIPAVPISPFVAMQNDLYSIGVLYRTQSTSFNRALTCCSERKPGQLKLALAAMRDCAQTIAGRARALEDRLSADDFENATQVYGGE